MVHSLYSQKPKPKSKPVPIAVPKRETLTSIRINVTGITLWAGMSLKAENLTIASYCHSDLDELDLNRFEWLRSIEIGDMFFASVKNFKVDGLNRLKTLKIGKKSLIVKRKEYMIIMYRNHSTY